MQSTLEAQPSEIKQDGISGEAPASRIDYAKGGKKPKAKRLAVVVATLLFALAGDVALTPEYFIYQDELLLEEFMKDQMCFEVNGPIEVLPMAIPFSSRIIRRYSSAFT